MFRRNSDGRQIERCWTTTRDNEFGRTRAPVGHYLRRGRWRVERRVDNYGEAATTGVRARGFRLGDAPTRRVLRFRPDSLGYTFGEHAAL